MTSAVASMVGSNLQQVVNRLTVVIRSSAGDPAVARHSLKTTDVFINNGIHNFVPISQSTTEF